VPKDNVTRNAITDVLGARTVSVDAELALELLKQRAHSLAAGNQRL
jgi:hypothetical protein